MSTSRVRGDVLAGAVEHVRELLGRPYRLLGIVGVGQRRGKTLGFPTANLNDVDNLVPGNGVYAVQAMLAGANLAAPPTSAPTRPSAKMPARSKCICSTSKGTCTGSAGGRFHREDPRHARLCER